MKTDYKPKRNLGCWWFLIVPGLLLPLFCIQLWGPSPGIRVSRKTTYIESHLGPDGLPRYAEYINDRLSKGVTTDNNAAVLYWRALWPSELRGNALSQELICRALGMPIPNPNQGLVDLSVIPKEDLADWIKTHVLAEVIAAAKVHEAEQQAAYDAEFDAEEDEEGSDESYYGDESAGYLPNVGEYETLANEMADNAISTAMTAPWSTTQAPILAQWAKDNKQALDWLVEGSARPEYYSPSPNMLDGSDDSMIMMLLPGVQMLRTGARALTCRAMWHLGEGRVEESWADIKACHQMARHTAKGWTMVERLVAIAIDQMASTTTQALLHHGSLTSEQSRRILQDLENMAPLPGMADAIDEGERLAFLDVVTRMGSGRMNAADLQLVGSGGSGGSDMVSVVTATKIDWNIVLDSGNEWYDRMAEASKLPRQERMPVTEKIEADLEKLSSTMLPARMAGSLISSKARSEVVSDMLICLFLPAVGAGNEASDRSQTIYDMNRIAAALAIVRAESGAYPASLDALFGIFPAVQGGGVQPLDIYSGKPFIYKKDGEGYLLYSVFRNGVDDGGTSLDGKIENGMWIKQGQPVDQMKSDLVVLMPLPEFEIAPPATD